MNVVQLTATGSWPSDQTQTTLLYCCCNTVATNQLTYPSLSTRPKLRFPACPTYQNMSLTFPTRISQEDMAEFYANK